MVKPRRHAKDFYSFAKGHVTPKEGEDVSDEVNSRLEDGYDVLLLGNATLKKPLLLTTDYQGIDLNGYTLTLDTGAFNNDVYADRYSVSNANGKKYATAIYANTLDGVWVRNGYIRPDSWIDSRYLKAIYFATCNDILVEKIEASHFSRSAGIICGNDCTGGDVVFNYIHDCWTNATTGTAAEAQLTAIEFDSDCLIGSTELNISFNRIRNLTMGAAAWAALGYQTDGINLQGNRTKPSAYNNITHNRIYNIGDGIDVFGNDNIIAHNRIERNWNRGIKLIHGASRNRIESNVIRNSGTGGIIVSGSGNASVGNSDNNSVRFNSIRNVGIVADWENADGTKSYDLAGAGGVGAHAAITTHGIDLFDVSNAVTFVVTNTIVEGNDIDLGSTGKVGIRAGSYTNASPTNIAKANRISNWVTAEYQDTYNALIVKEYPDSIPIQGMYLLNNYTLTSTTSNQPLFNVTTNGAMAVRGSTRYRFRCRFTLTSLSSSSGHFKFGFGTSGGATINTCRWTAWAHKQGGGIATCQTGNTNGATPVAVTSDSTATGGIAMIEGVIRIGTAGRIIPQIALSVAAAGVVESGSFFEMWPVSEFTASYLGDIN